MEDPSEMLVHSVLPDHLPAVDPLAGDLLEARHSDEDRQDRGGEAEETFEPRNEILIFIT